MKHIRGLTHRLSQRLASVILSTDESTVWDQSQGTAEELLEGARRLLLAVPKKLILLSVIITLTGTGFMAWSTQVQVWVSQSPTYSLIIAMSIALGFHFVIQAITRTINLLTTRRVEERLQQELREKESKVKPGDLDQAFPDDDHKRQTTLVSYLAYLAGELISGTITNFIVVIAFLGVIRFTFGWTETTIVSVSLLPLTLALWLMPRFRRLVNSVFVHRSRMNANTVSFFSSLSLLQILNFLIPGEQKVFHEEVQQYKRAFRRSMLMRIILQTMPVFLSTFLLQFLVYSWVLMMQSDTYEYAHAVQLATYGSACAVALGVVLTNVTTTTEYTPELVFLGRAMMLKEVRQGTKTLPGGLVEIRFVEVKFGYNGDCLISSPISFTLRLGEMVTIVGPSGCGKSTIFGLLNLFSEVELHSGKVVLVTGTGEEVVLSAANGESAELNHFNLSQHLRQVIQGDGMLPGTVLENVDPLRYRLSDEQHKLLAKSSRVKPLENGEILLLREPSKPWEVVKEFTVDPQFLEILKRSWFQKYRKQHTYFLSPLGRTWGLHWRLRRARRLYQGTRWWAPLTGRTIIEAVTGSLPEGIRSLLHAENLHLESFDEETGRYLLLRLSQEKGAKPQEIPYALLRLTEKQWERLLLVWAALETAGILDEIENHDKWLLATKKELSGGQQRRVMLARALLEGNRVMLVMDETLSQLDPPARGKVLTGLERAKNSIGFLMVAHTADAIPDNSRVLVICKKNGIICNGIKAELERGTDNPYLRHFYPQRFA